jgi:hypothetical protein
VITLQLVFSPAPWVRSVGYTLLMITIRWQTCLYYSQGCLDTWWLHFIYLLEAKRLSLLRIPLTKI